MEKHEKVRLDEFGRDVTSRDDGRDGERVREMGRNQRVEAGHGQRRTGTEESSGGLGRDRGQVRLDEFGLDVRSMGKVYIYIVIYIYIYIYIYICIYIYIYT
jgi:hypothetical protein